MLFHLYFECLLVDSLGTHLTYTLFEGLRQ